MSIQAISVIRQASRIWNRPSDKRLDSDALVDILNRVFSQLKLELGLSGGSFLAKVSDVFTIDDDSRVLKLSDAALPSNFLQIRLEARAASGTGKEIEWREVNIGTFADWETYRYIRQPYAAFYGSNDAPSVVVNHSPLGLVYRLIYEPEGAFAGEEVDGIDFPRLFQPLMVYSVAIEAGMVMDDYSPEFQQMAQRKIQMLIGLRDEAKMLFKKWLTSRRSQSVTTRQGFNERDSDLFGFGGYDDVGGIGGLGNSYGLFGGTVVVPSAELPEEWTIKEW